MVDKQRLQECTLAIYENCLNSAKRATLQCAKNCPTILCNQIRYMAERVKRNPLPISDAKVTIGINSLTYIVYTEYFLYSFEALISNLGGILGLWLGLCFLTFIEYCHFFFQFISGVGRILLNTSYGKKVRAFVKFKWEASKDRLQQLSKLLPKRLSLRQEDLPKKHKRKKVRKRNKKSKGHYRKKAHQKIKKRSKNKRLRQKGKIKTSKSKARADAKAKTQNEAETI